MDIEFHYYVTYLTSVIAGFDPDSAYVIAYSSQYVDDNDITFEINGDTTYENYISQTFNITKPQGKLQRIYSLFHFIPGEAEQYSREITKDEYPTLTTTPNSIYANQMIDKALESGNLYRIGLAAHAYLDTWSHQNFIGTTDSYNSKSFLNPLNLCHANAGHKPDRPGLVWEDNRLINSEIDNNKRFLEAISYLYDKLSNQTNSSINKSNKERLITDIEEIIYNEDTKEFRIDKYKELALKDIYSGKRIPDYNKFKWFNEAICEDYPEERTIEIFYQDFNLKDAFFKDYTWADHDNYEDTHWYKFQKAVKDHQEMMIDILDELLDEVKDMDEW
ncbi:hypothetical protein I0Q91_03825 [Halanaerobiaceae bacterium Z-7014]|uniref:Uncharacterized protein n=1 Tax=Halonatronomonas betaini TaxID=2778430 RepID=A0A931F9S2_9FIRM|nr:DUF6765 family protein [Halonatronomonas betaini]MBF8436197.1 hypothetical protein [Halonatronomonas betaini]